MKLKEIRESRGISQRQAALALNLSPTVYNRYENGLREPSNALLLVIADYFGVTVDEILGRQPAPDGQTSPVDGNLAAMYAKFSLLSPADQQRVLDFAEGILSARER